MGRSIVWAGFTVDDNNYDQSTTQHFFSIGKIYRDQVSLLEETYTLSREKGKLKRHRSYACTESTVVNTVSFKFFSSLALTTVLGLYVQEKESS